MPAQEIQVIDLPGPHQDDRDLGYSTKALERSILGQARGLVDPNPGVGRLRPFPAEMASPPTIQIGSSGGGSVITNSVLIEGDDFTRLRGFGADVITWVSASTFSIGRGATGPNEVMQFSIEFCYDGDELELRLRGTGVYTRIWIDGEMHTLVGASEVMPGDGGIYLLHIDFGSRKPRTIRVEGDRGMYFGGVQRGPTSTVWLPHNPLGPRCIVMGDSITGGEGSGTVNGLDLFTRWMGYALGWNDVWASAVGSTGYVATGGYTTFGGRVQADVIAHDPDVVLIAGGINDHAGSQPAILAAAQSLYSSILDGIPGVALIVVGPWWPNGAPPQTVIDTRNTLESAATSEGVHLFIDNIVADVAGDNYLGWITGTGREGATNTSGNSDVYTSTDATHPTTAGQRYLGWRLAQAISQGLPVLGTPYLGTQT
jgi:lysophospholipase L1-like esterase